MASSGGDIRYCHAYVCWLYWDGTRWRQDDSGAVERLAKDICRSMFLEAAELDRDSRNGLFKHALKSEQEARIRAMINLAKSELGIPISPDELDRNPFLLNVQNGTIDLTTGVLRPHRREDFITCIAPVEYDPVASSVSSAIHLRGVAASKRFSCTAVRVRMERRPC